jgi:undecaprenyl-diphosphatase
MIQAILFGILQGLTEFFPISSSGHLVIFKHIMPGMEQWSQSIEFEVAVHMGTTISVLVLFWRDVVDILKECLNILRAAIKRDKGVFTTQPGIPMVAAIVVGTIPTGIIALLFKDTFERMFSSVGLVGVTLAITGTLLWATRWFDKPGREDASPAPRRPLTFIPAFVVGIVQGIAITPGISRSGSTISAGLMLRLDRETAGKFSFLLSVPAILGACVLKLRHGLELGGPRLYELMAGTVAAAVVGYICLRLLMPLIKHGRFHYFAYYCWLAAAAALLLSCR